MTAQEFTTQNSANKMSCMVCGAVFKPNWNQRKRGYASCSRACKDKSVAVPLELRFWKHVTKSEGCWLWAGKRLPRGYGIVSVTHTTTRLAHRVAYQLTYGDFDNSLKVLHKCDNPPCVNPEHLFLGTDADNVHDMDKKGRRRTVVTGRKLTDDEVRFVRSLPSPYPHRQAAEMARALGVSRSVLWLARSRRTYKHVN